MKAVLISIGSEVVSGVIADTNGAFLARELRRLGIDVVRHETVGDGRDDIRSVFEHAASLADVVIASGGLGPTLDDLTRDGLAGAMDVSLEYCESLMEMIGSYFKARNIPMPNANKRQAMIPTGAEPIQNRWGTAPGIRGVVDGVPVFCLPGVPREMKAMFQAEVVPALQAAPGRASVIMSTLHIFGVGESTLGEQIEDLMAAGRNPSVGTMAVDGGIDVRIVASGDSERDMQSLLDADVEVVRKRLGDHVFGRDEDTLASVVGAMLAEKSETVATAESCTGGMIASMLTDVSGSSTYFEQGFVTYSNQAKAQWLGVPESIIEEHGAVSAEVASVMAQGCRERASSDYALSVTGVAGPTGGTDEKPVGLVWFGLAHPGGVEVYERRFGSYLNRAMIRYRTALTALDALRRLLVSGPGGLIK